MRRLLIGFVAALVISAAPAAIVTATVTSAPSLAPNVPTTIKAVVTADTQAEAGTYVYRTVTFPSAEACVDAIANLNEIMAALSAGQTPPPGEFKGNMQVANDTIRMYFVLASRAQGPITMVLTCEQTGDPA